jgi:hypothetical protein
VPERVIAAEEDRHGEGRRLALGHPPVGQPGDEGLEGVVRERLPVALEADQFLRQQRHG